MIHLLSGVYDKDAQVFTDICLTDFCKNTFPRGRLRFILFKTIVSMAEQLWIRASRGCVDVFDSSRGRCAKFQDGRLYRSFVTTPCVS
jgi:hypothetical protein